MHANEKSNTTEDIRSLLIHERKAQRMTQQELAERSGLSTRTIQRMERGDAAPREHSLKRIMEVLEISWKKNPSTDSAPGYSDEMDIKFTYKVMVWSSLLAFFAPLNIFVLSIFRRFYRKDFRGNKTALRVFSFQVLWSAFQILMVFLIPLVSSLLFGQRMVGQSAMLQVAYVFLSILNLFVLVKSFLSLKKGNREILSYIPTL